MKHSNRTQTGETRKFRVLNATSHRKRCLVTDMHPERGLSRALCLHLGYAMHNFEFSLDEVGEFDCIWVCGYEPEQVGRVRELRRQYPNARILVTGGRSRSDWQSAALRAGANSARQWPLSRVSLRQLLAGAASGHVSEAS